MNRCCDNGTINAGIFQNIEIGNRGYTPTIEQAPLINGTPRFEVIYTRTDAFLRSHKSQVEYNTTFEIPVTGETVAQPPGILQWG